MENLQFIARQAAEGAEIGATFVLGGTVVSGVLVPYVQYGQWFMEAWGRAAGQDPDETALAAAALTTVPIEVDFHEVEEVAGFTELYLRDARVWQMGREAFTIPFLVIHAARVSAYSMTIPE